VSRNDVVAFDAWEKPHLLRCRLHLVRRDDGQLMVAVLMRLLRQRSRHVRLLLRRRPHCKAKLQRWLCRRLALLQRLCGLLLRHQLLLRLLRRGRHQARRPRARAASAGARQRHRRRHARAHGRRQRLRQRLRRRRRAAGGRRWPARAWRAAIAGRPAGGRGARRGGLPGRGAARRARLRRLNAGDAAFHVHCVGRGAALAVRIEQQHLRGEEI